MTFRLFLSFFVIVFYNNLVFGQNFTADFIKSVSFHNSNNLNPIIALGETFTVSFDDLEADQKNYYYQIQHCNYDWQVSSLQPTEFMNGYTSFEIQDFVNSFGTYQDYTHHSFKIPNRNSRIKISGNYLLTILNDNDEICVQRRFVIYEPTVVISAQTVRERSIQEIKRKQVVQFSIYHPNIVINNPTQELKAVIIQNNDWNIAKKDIQPQFFKKNEISYRYNDETSFYGGNEFLNFDTKNTSGSNINILRTQLENHYFHSYLHPNRARHYLPYTYFPDINGGFTIRTLNGNETNTESEYALIHFSLDSIGIDSKNKDYLYVYGAFNNYAFTEENRLKYNPKSKQYETALLFKQGFYNYTHVVKKPDSPLDYYSIDGSFQETENDYTILIYYQPFGERITKIIGMSKINSKN